MHLPAGEQFTPAPLPQLDLNDPAVDAALNQKVQAAILASRASGRIGSGGVRAPRSPKDEVSF